MLTPASIDLVADRWVPFNAAIAIIGIDFTGATFSAHIRSTPDASGSALVTMANVTTSATGVRLAYGGTDTIANHITADRLSEVPDGYSSGDSVALSQVVLQVATVDATNGVGTLPFPAERGDDAVFYYDLHVTPSGGTKAVYLSGTLTVRAGVTR
jgi:hypothetical protein